ncbi:MAG: acylphosphatase [Burkholderiales bacterium]
MLTRHVFGAGQVQGVGYRDGLHAQALRHGVSGWVRNRRDGKVEAILQGEAAAVESVLAWARRGPPAARVTDVTTQPATGGLDRRYPGFDWLPSA